MHPPILSVDGYRPRVVDARITRLLQGVGAVVLEGPRGCGKTMTGLQHCSSHVLLDDPGVTQMATLEPDVLLDGATPRLLDEWQLYPDLWNLARRRIDATNSKGLFLLAGSAVPDEDVRRHSGAGRFVRIRQYTMTWSEKLDHPHHVSLSALLTGERPSARVESPTLPDVVDALLTPGFPALIDTPADIAAETLRSYLTDTAQVDIHRLADIRQKPLVVQQLLVALARSTASEISLATLRKDLAQVMVAPSIETVTKLVQLLRRMFVVEATPAFGGTLQSRARLRQAPKYHLADPALAAAALGADRRRLETDGRMLGLLFESAVVHDLRVYAEALGGTVTHYRDSNGHEIDAIVDLPDGRWMAVEVKVGQNQVSAGLESLDRAVRQIRREPPVMKAVITGNGFTAPLADGAVTFPLWELGP